VNKKSQLRSYPVHCGKRIFALV